MATGYICPLPRYNVVEILERSCARSTISSSLSKVLEINLGIDKSDFTYSFSRSLVNDPFEVPILIARHAKTTNWQVKALVDATPISGPA